jgi:hypothetical protein
MGRTAATAQWSLLRLTKLSFVPNLVQIWNFSASLVQVFDAVDLIASQNDE